MLNFKYSNKTEVIFGKDTQHQVGELTKAYGGKVLLHYGGGSIKKTGLYDAVVKSLNEAGVEFIELAGVQPNPRLALVEQGIALCREENVTFILAVGGGSVIDSAKAISAGFYLDKPVWSLYESGGDLEKVLPIGVVLTIPAAGSETSNSTVITNDDGQFKKGYGHMLLRPVFCILNPELTYTLPTFQTGCGASDMLAHVMERYFVPTKNVELTDRLCEATMKTIIAQAPLLMADPENYEARAEIMWSGTIAHSDILDTGRGGDWASHNIEHELSGIYDIAHGAGLSIVFPAWMKYVYETDKPRFYKFATRVFNVEHDFENPDATIIKGIQALEAFYQSIGMPIRLSEEGIDSTNFELMAQKATGNGSYTLGSFKALTKEDIVEIYKLAL